MDQANPHTDRFEYALRLGDDALTLGHRLSEWCSNGPYLEEDIALINIALDYIGRARMFLSLAGAIEGRGRDEDQLAYLRDCRQFRNLLICELPRGDFADTIARQFLVDSFQALYFDALSRSGDQDFAAIAAKSLKEARYHVRHTGQWMIRLGDGTEESHRRLQDALDRVWGYTGELFMMDELEQRLADDGVAVDRGALRADWDHQVNTVLSEATLHRPDDDWRIEGGRRGEHTEHLGHLLSDLQFMQRAYPGQQW